jgi:hypothetical protein
MLTAHASTGAAAYTFNFDTVFDGATPTGSGPWVTAVFQDVSPGTVDLTISGPGLTAGESLGDLFFNLNSALNPMKLKFTETAETGSFKAPSISKGVNAFSPDNEGEFDLKLSFGSTAATEFVSGDSVEYAITGVAGLDAADFATLDYCSSGTGLYYAAADINGVGKGCKTGWIAATSSNMVTTVPEPSLALFLPFAAGLGAAWRALRRRVS